MPRLGHLIVRLYVPWWTKPAVHGALLLARVGVITRTQFIALAGQIAHAPVRRTRFTEIRP